MDEEHTRLVVWKDKLDAEKEKIADLDPSHWRVKVFQDEMKAYAAAWEGKTLCADSTSAPFKLLNSTIFICTQTWHRDGRPQQVCEVFD